MCRNIKMLFNFEPPVTDEEIRAASLQFVRKVSGFNKPSKANECRGKPFVLLTLGILESTANVQDGKISRRRRWQTPEMTESGRTPGQARWGDRPTDRERCRLSY